jgi:NADP-dependent 3-hydroxy acid dehydrogenase YdfG
MTAGTALVTGASRGIGREVALVNNAGVYRGPTRRIWDVNVLGPLRNDSSTGEATKP